MAEESREKMEPYLYPELTESILAAAFKVQRALGPGLLESAYAACLIHELRQKGHQVLTELEVEIDYEGLRIPNAFRLDLLVDNAVIVELKTVERLLDVHHAQVMSYLRFSGCQVGLLLNFWAWPLKEGGIKRVVRTVQTRAD